MSYSFKYSEIQGEPSLPILDIKVWNDFGDSMPEKGKVDTGSYITVIPPKIIKKLKLETTGEQEWVGGYKEDDEGKAYDTYDIYVEIGQSKFGLLRVISEARSNVLIGRDLINLWLMKLDGENQLGEIIPWSTDPEDVV